MDKFDKLVEFLKEKDYTVTVSNETGGYRFAKVTGNLILGGFAELNGNVSYSYINDKISFDNIKCFDKWSKCPVCLPLPETEEQFNFLYSKLKLLATNYGYEKSSTFELFINEYPQ